MTYSFGPFRYDAAQRLLFREGEPVALAPKTLETLHVLLERHGQVVEKAELMKLVWPDTHVEEIGLARNISLLRKALDDESDENPYIVTIPRRGYRFAAPVSTGTPPSSRPVSRRRFHLLLAGAAALAMAALIYYQFYVPSPWASRPPGAAALAVVPFDCLGPGMDRDAFCQGLDDVLVPALSKLEGVQVISPATVRRYRRMRISMSVMGRLLGLHLLVEGTVQRLDDRLHITPRLVDVRTGRVIWAETYDQPAADPGAAQAAVASATARAIGERLRAPGRFSETFPKPLRHPAAP